MDFFLLLVDNTSIMYITGIAFGIIKITEVQYSVYSMGEKCPFSVVGPLRVFVLFIRLYFAATDGWR